ncbi:MAG: Phage protein [Myxococcaceae bacterium]|nr:Phage protein [Myxococcaceae bacterium]
MADVFAGCLLDRLPSSRALTAARFIEYAPRPPLPTLATLARLRKQTPAWPQISLVAPRSTWTTQRGPMRPGPELDAGVDWITRVSDILSAFAIVLATGAELTTGERDGELLASFVERLRPTGRAIVIAPRGLWEPEHGTSFAERIGAIYGFDPLEHDAPEGTSLVYGRVRPMGARPRLTEGHLAQIAERMSAAECDRAFVSIESDQCVRDAKSLSKQLAELEGLEPPDDDDDDEAEEEDEEDED